jgi:hypothetical protein
MHITFDEFDMKKRDDNGVDVDEQQRQEIMDQKLRLFKHRLYKYFQKVGS